LAKTAFSLVVHCGSIIQFYQVLAQREFVCWNV